MRETGPARGAPYSALGRGMCEGPGIPQNHAGVSRQNRRWRWGLQRAVGLPSFVTAPPARPMELAGAGVQSKGVTGDSLAEAVPVGMNTSADAASAVARATRRCDNGPPRAT